MEWLDRDARRPGAGAAAMMPTSIAIVSAVFARGERGRALGILAGASAFSAALGPFIGGALRSLDYPGIALFAIGCLVLGLGQGRDGPGKRRRPSAFCACPPSHSRSSSSSKGWYVSH
jgi:MFS family permease